MCLDGCGKALEIIISFKNGDQLAVASHICNLDHISWGIDFSFDFVFIDADKDWYTNYLKSLLPKLEVGGYFTAHMERISFLLTKKRILFYLNLFMPNIFLLTAYSAGKSDEAIFFSPT